jgi:hypothetical protein
MKTKKAQKVHVALTCVGGVPTQEPIAVGHLVEDVATGSVWQVTEVQSEWPPAKAKGKRA